MPFIYSCAPKMTNINLENLTTNGTPNTQNDFFFLKPGSSRVAAVLALRVQGKGGGLTALSGISIRLAQWTGSASTSVGGSSVTPVPKNNLAPACVGTAGMASAAASTITSGTTGPNFVGVASCGASGPGGWVAANPDDTPILDGNASKSSDLFSSSPTASLNFEFMHDHMES